MTSPLIQVEQTPNPEAIRILPGVPLMSGAPLEFRLGDDCSKAPLADELLAIAGVETVMLAPDFVTVVRSSPDHAWVSLKPHLIAAVADFLLSERPMVGARRPGEGPDFGGDLVSAQIHDVIQRFVRPLLARDGGEATLESFDHQTGVARVRMGGACGGCPSGATTLKRGIEQTIKRYVPEVTRVESTEPAPIADPKARFRAWVAARWGRD